MKEFTDRWTGSTAYTAPA